MINLRSFLREARITSYLQHPGILPIYEVSGESDPYFVCKLLRGGSLMQKLSELGDEHALINLFKKICEAMDYAHSRGVLHLDLKPENIHIDKFGEALIIDWGLAEIICTDDVESPLDNPLIAKRVPLQVYLMESVRPDSCRQSKLKLMCPVKRAMFFLWVLYFFMFQKEAPFKGSSVDEVCSNTLRQNPEELRFSGVSSGVQAIIKKCLS